MTVSVWIQKREIINVALQQKGKEKLAFLFRLIRLVVDRYQQELQSQPCSQPDFHLRERNSQPSKKKAISHHQVKTNAGERDPARSRVHSGRVTTKMFPTICSTLIVIFALASLGTVTTILVVCKYEMCFNITAV